MKRFLKGFMSIMLVASSVSGYAMTANSNPSFAEDSNGTYLEGQLIVSIEENSLPPSRGGDEMSEQVSAIEDAGIQVLDSLLDTEDDMRSMGNDSIGPLNSDLKEEIIDNMGYVYLVEYPEKAYSNIDEAKAGVEKALEEKGLKVRYVEPNYQVEAYDLEETAAPVVTPEVVAPEATAPVATPEVVTPEVTAPVATPEVVAPEVTAPVVTPEVIAPEATAPVVTPEVAPLVEEPQASEYQLHPEQAWHYNMINAPQAWTVTEGSPNVKIAVLDTGIDYNHPNLKNFVDLSLGKSFVGGSVMDKQKHGTHVAGTIASYGSVSGVMRNATLIPVKVLGDDGRGSNYGIQQGILYAANIDADVINMSLGGGGFSKGMNEACETATNQGVTIVAATGNNSSSSIGYPAAYDSVLAVGAVNQQKERAYFSQYGEGLDVMAPGFDIYSTIPNGGFTKLKGTSMATPHVAGVAGLIKSANGNLSPEEVKNILKQTAQPAGSSYEYGNGIVDAYAAVNAAK